MLFGFCVPSAVLVSFRIASSSFDPPLSFVVEYTLSKFPSTSFHSSAASKLVEARNPLTKLA